jgi:hypothetical protein
MRATMPGTYSYRSMDRLRRGTCLLPESISGAADAHTDRQRPMLRTDQNTTAHDEAKRMAQTAPLLLSSPTDA